MFHQIFLSGIELVDIWCWHLTLTFDGWQTDVQKLISKNPKIMKINKMILLANLFSGTNSKPITRDISMKNESAPGKQIHRRDGRRSTQASADEDGRLRTVHPSIRPGSTGDHECQKLVIIHCELETQTFSSENRLDVYEKCLLDGFTQLACGWYFQSQQFLILCLFY